jgi:hypothetical protein
LLKARFPAALAMALGVGAVSIGAAMACWRWHWPAGTGFELVAHCAAMLAFFWAAVALLVHQANSRMKARSDTKDLIAVLDVATLVAALLVVIPITYAAVTEVLGRSPFLIDYNKPWLVDLWPTGLLDLGLVLGSVVVTWGRTRSRTLVTVCFWVLILAGVWFSLQIPSIMPVTTPHGQTYLAPAPWTQMLMFWATGVILAFALAESLYRSRRRRRAWPDHLSYLTESPEGWPGYDYSMALVGLVVLLFGLIHITRLGSTVSVVLAGGAILSLAHRRWNSNLGDLGLSLISVGIVSVPMRFPMEASQNAGALFAEIFNRALIGLAVATAFWHWLMQVWHQQLDDGRAWTTAGRLLGSARRTGYLCGATGVLVGFQLALWPLLPEVTILDHSAWRWSLGLAGNGLLVLALVYAVRSTRKTTLAWLTLWALGASGTFALTRLRPSPIGSFWSLCWPIVVALLSLVLLGTGWLTSHSKKWRPFVPPLLTGSLLLAPAAALVGTLLKDPIKTPVWTTPATLGVLAVVYLLGAFKPGPRWFLVLSVLAGSACIYSLSAASG